MDTARIVRLNVLQQSPHDLVDPGPEAAVTEQGPERWVSSRYNVRATTEDGKLILWNTFRNSMSVFKAEQAPTVLGYLEKAGVEGRADGLVGYLVERGFLVRKGVHEYRQFQLAFGRQHYRTDALELILMSSEDCNFRCKYCYEEFARGTMRPEVRSRIKRLIEKRAGSLQHLRVDWFGGEPLYGWEALEDLAPFCLETAQRHGIRYGAGMTTNGYLLSPQVADALLSWNIRNFQITLDGAPEDHDCNRPTRDGRGTFRVIFENLKSMAQRRDEFSVSLRINFDQTNAARMDVLLDLLKQEFEGDGRFKLDFHPVGRWGGPNDAALQVCGAEEQTALLEAFKAAAHARGLRFATLKDVNALGGQACYAARPYNLLIGASGKVMKCTVLLDMDERNVVGRIEEDGELVLDADRMALWTEPAFESDEHCRQCAVLPSCQGIHCPLVRLERQGARPCVSTKHNAKTELREALAYGGAGARTRTVGASSR